MWKFRRPVLSILSAILICALLMVSFPVLDTLINPEGPSSGTSEVLADDGCEGCSGSYEKYKQEMAKYDWCCMNRDSCDSTDERRAYQAYIAAYNKLNQCLDRGCDTTGPQTDSDGDGVPDDVDPDDDNDGIPDICDECPRTELGAAVDAKGCPIVMQLSVSTDKETYSPGETVWVDGSVKDAEGNGILEVYIDIKVEGTDLSTDTYSRMVYDVDGGSSIGYITPRLSIPFDFPPGTYTVKVAASKKGYPDVSETTSITVVPPTISLCPSTVPGGDVKKTIEIKGTGFGANEQINIVLGTGTVVDSISAEADGSFRVKCDIPKTELRTVGEKHTIDAIGTLHTANAEFIVGPSLYDIGNVWFRWGEEKGTWPDGSTDTRRAFHHCFGGGAAANARQMLRLPPHEKQEASHFGCLACQWKTLYFFVQQGKKGNLGGWEFFPIKVFGTRLGEMGGHHAVVLYPAHGNWKTDGYVFDPHQKGIPDSWAVQHISEWDSWDRFFVSFDGYKFDPYWFGGKIVDGSFVRDYDIDIGCGFKDAYRYVAYEEFPDDYVDEWMTPEETEEYRVKYEKSQAEGRTNGGYGGYLPNSSFYQKCPVNFLVVNSAGERLGRIENGEWVFEFKPEKLDTWPGEDNSPVWYIELPEGDVYTILITGTGSGNLEVFALLEGSRVVFKYPPVEVSAGDKFSMKLDADDPGTPLDTPKGQVSPTEIPIEEFIAVVEPIEGNNPPTASFSIMPQNPTPEDTIVGVSASSDPDGDVLTYSWYFDGEYDENIGNLPEWTWPNPQAGEYNIKLVVDDGWGGSDEYSMAVTVVGGDGNRPPTASFSIMPQNPTPEDTIVGVSASSDPDGDVLTYSWYFDGEYDENLGNLPDWTWPNPQAGEYNIKLVVDDGRGGSDEYTMPVTVAGDGEGEGGGSAIIGIIFLIIIAAVAVFLIRRRGKKRVTQQEQDSWRDVGPPV